MLRKYISQFSSGDIIDSVFLVQRKELRTTKNGSLYIQTQLADRTGVIDARMWDANSKFFESLENESFLKIKGKTELYQNRMQLIIQRISKTDESEITLSDYLPSTRKNINNMLSDL